MTAPSPSSGPSPNRSGVALAVATVAALTLVAVEGRWAWALLGVPAWGAWAARAPVVLVGWTVFVGAVAAADVSLVALGTDPLGWRGRRVAAEARLRVVGDPRRVVDACAGSRFAPGDAGDPGPPRDARGWQVWTVGGPDPLTVGVVGDSVLHGQAGRLLHAAATEADRPLRLVDTSVYSYGWTAYRCMAGELVADEQPDLVLLGLVLNDLPVSPGIDLDVGKGTHTYDWLGIVPADLARARLPPLLLDGRFPWVAARRPDLDARWPGALVFDVVGADLLAPLAAAVDVPSRPRRALDALWSTLADTPTVAIAFPALYDRRPDPRDLLVDRGLALAVEGGARALDVRPMLRVHPMLEATEAPGGTGALGRGEGLYDPVHLSDAALGMTLAAALLASEDPRLADTARALARRAGGAWACGARRCAVPTLREEDGVVVASGGCLPPAAGGCAGGPTPRDR